MTQSSQFKGILRENKPFNFFFILGDDDLVLKFFGWLKKSFILINNLGLPNKPFRGKDGQGQPPENKIRDKFLNLVYCICSKRYRPAQCHGYEYLFIVSVHCKIKEIGH